MTTRRSMPRRRSCRWPRRICGDHHGPYCSQFNDTLNVYDCPQCPGLVAHTAGVDLAKVFELRRRYIARPTKRGARLSTGCLPDHVCCPQCRPQRLPNDLFGLTTPAAQADPSRVAMNSEGTVDLPGNDFDSNDFDAVDLWVPTARRAGLRIRLLASGRRRPGHRTRPGQCPRSGGDGHRTRDRAFTVTNPHARCRYRR